jgi:hypothetical protein
MTWVQFAIFLGMTTAVLVVAVEVGLRLRWRSIEAMFDRALMHGGSLDTLSKALKAAAEESGSRASSAIEAVRLLKAEVDESKVRLRRLEEHPILRPLGGNGNKL